MELKQFFPFLTVALGVSFAAKPCAQTPKVELFEGKDSRRQGRKNEATVATTRSKELAVNLKLNDDLIASLK